MSHYGVNNYGAQYEGGPATYYGADPTIAAPYFTATPTGYGEIALVWGPIPSVPGAVWDRMKIVRNGYGFPVDSDDGVVIHESSTGSSMPNPDTDLSQGKEVYYGLFVRANGVWYRAAIASGLSVKDFGTHTKMMNSLPTAVKSISRTIVDANEENQDLSDFIKIVAFEYDYIMTQAYLIKGAIDPSSAPAALLPALMDQLGLRYEQALGYHRMRAMAKNAVLINQSRGSLDGLGLFIKSFSGYDASVAIGKNLFLDYNSSSFEETPTESVPGLWQFTNATGLTSATPAPFEKTPNEPTDEYPNRRAGVLEITPDGSSDITMVCGDAVIKDLIPVSTTNLNKYSATQAEDYTFSIYAQSSSGTTEGTIGIEWYNIYGELLSTSSSPFSGVTSGDWTRVSVSDSAPYAKTLSGSVYATNFAETAAFARPVVTITTYTGAQYFDAAQFEKSVAASSFEDARRIKITVSANRINEITNPNFSVDYSDWDLTNYDSLKTGVTESSGTNAHEGFTGKALEIYPDAADTVTASTTVGSVSGSVVGDNYYTFSIYGSVAEYGDAAATSDDMSVSITWLTASHGVISSVTSDVLTYERNTSSEFSALNQILFDGQVAVETDTYRWKVGDGSTAWRSLPYASAEVIHQYNTESEWSGITDPLPVGAIGVETDTSKFKIGDGTSAWSDLSYTTSLPAWVRLYITGRAPSNAKYAVLTASWTPSSLDASILLDAALFEKGQTVNPFFDGNTGAEDLTSIKWEGTANASPSQFYRNHLSVNRRLMATLPEYLPAGSTFAIYYAVPRPVWSS